MIKPTNLDSQSSEFAASTNFTDVNVLEAKVYCVASTVTVTTPAAGAFTAATTDICTKATHGFKTGLKVRLTTSGVLPAGLSLATDYFVIYLTVDTFKLASSLLNAQAGTAVDITDTGTGTHTITATALAGCTAKLQALVTGGSYTDIANSEFEITVTEPLMWEYKNPGYSLVRTVYTLTAGQISVSQLTLVKEAF